jgi:hypothetical protein
MKKDEDASKPSSLLVQPQSKHWRWADVNTRYYSGIVMRVYGQCLMYTDTHGTATSILFPAVEYNYPWFDWASELPLLLLRPFLTFSHFTITFHVASLSHPFDYVPLALFCFVNISFAYCRCTIVFTPIISHFPRNTFLLYLITIFLW